MVSGARIVLATGLVRAVVACAPPPPAPPVAATSDLVVPPIGARPKTAAPDAPMCKARLTAGSIEKSSPTCYLDQDLAQAEGELEYPCTGDGTAEARFGALRFTGVVRGGELALEVRTELDWEQDGCRWGTTGTLRGRGPFGKGAKLEWRYEDYVLRGDDCSGSCTARAAIAVRAHE